MMLEILRAVLVAGVPVGVTSYLLVWWALRQGYIGPVSSLKEAELGLRRLSKEKSAAQKSKRKNKKKSARDVHAGQDRSPGTPVMTPFHGKWLAFGGGFYGVVGLLTYGVVELGELRDFFFGFDSLSTLISHFGVDLFIGIFIGALRNFIVAIAWPAFWLSDIQSDHIWIWFLVAYAAYWAGARLAVQRFATGAI